MTIYTNLFTPPIWQYGKIVRHCEQRVFFSNRRFGRHSVGLDRKCFGGDRRISLFPSRIEFTVKVKAPLRQSPSQAPAAFEGNLRKNTRLRLTRLMACQPKPWRRLVEVAGIEPASEDRTRKASTC